MEFLPKILKAHLQNVQAVFSYSSFVYIQEVPFQRWWVYTNFDATIPETCERWKARGWAVLNLIEGSFRALISVIVLVYNHCLGNDELTAKKHRWILKEQRTGLKYTLLAIWDPNALKTAIHTKRSEYAQNPFFGYKSLIWGTRYTGTLEVDFCTINHPWASNQGGYPWELEQQ